MDMMGNFDYLVDFGQRSGMFHVRETRTPLASTNDKLPRGMVDTGLPVLALIFYPALRTDYEMRCEGVTQWNNHPAWVVYFRQIKGKRPRTASIATPTQLYPISLKGRAWIAADSGQVLHLETNLMRSIPVIGLEENAFSVDYGPVKFQSQDVEIWLPQFAVGYTDYAKHRMITEHTYSDFQLFSVQTQETIQKPSELRSEQ